jgi:hypothetical protein
MGVYNLELTKQDELKLHRIMTNLGLGSIEDTIVEIVKSARVELKVEIRSSDRSRRELADEFLNIISSGLVHGVIELGHDSDCLEPDDGRVIGWIENDGYIFLHATNAFEFFKKQKLSSSDGLSRNALYKNLKSIDAIHSQEGRTTVVRRCGSSFVRVICLKPGALDYKNLINDAEWSSAEDEWSDIVNIPIVGSTVD